MINTNDLKVGMTIQMDGNILYNRGSCSRGTCLCIV